MADQVKYKWGTEAQILALTVNDASWVNRAFYYPSDKSYFYQAVDGVMRKYGDGASAWVGISINDAVIGGVKRLIQTNETLRIPDHYDYNTYKLTVDGHIILDGKINFL